MAKPRIQLKPGIDLGLAVIEAVRQAGETLTCTDIAAICGCTRQNIQQIEARALAKIRRAGRRRPHTALHEDAA